MVYHHCTVTCVEGNVSPLYCACVEGNVSPLYCDTRRGQWLSDDMINAGIHMRLRECKQFCFFYEALIRQAIAPYILNEFEKESKDSGCNQTILYQFPPAVRISSSHTVPAGSAAPEAIPTQTPIIGEVGEAQRQQIIDETQAKYQNLTSLHADSQFGHQDGEGESLVVCVCLAVTCCQAAG